MWGSKGAEVFVLLFSVFVLSLLITVILRFIALKKNKNERRD